MVMTRRQMMDLMQNPQPLEEKYTKDAERSAKELMNPTLQKPVVETESGNTAVIKDGTVKFSLPSQDK